MKINTNNPDHGIFFDSESTGIPDWKKPSHMLHQPHIVRLAAKVVDLRSRQTIDEFDGIVKPNGWIIPQNTIDIHGITNEHANAVGLYEKEVLVSFLGMWNGMPRFSYNTTFDNRMIRIAIKRYLSERTAADWKQGYQGSEWTCVMLESKKAMGLYKNPKLEVAYKHFTGKVLQNAHDAMADVDACIELYFAILDHNSKSQTRVG